jgi:hypothetical protein
MGINAASHWVIRSDGDDENGALFADLDPGTSEDYSNQAAAQLSLSDIATDGAGTGLSSATGGFTAAMVGNGIYLTGGGATAGYYQITAYTDTNNVTIDRSAGASKSGVTGNVGGAVLTVQDSLFELPEPGNIVYIKSGTYNLSAHVYISKAGNATSPITIEGFNSTLGDDPTGDDRPLIDGQTYYFRHLGAYWIRKNVRFTSANTDYTVVSGSNGHSYNCKFGNTSADANSYALSCGSDNLIEDCEFSSSSGRGMYLAGSTHVVRSYIHDVAVYGAVCGSANGVSFVECIFDTCTTAGAYISSAISSFLFECCTIYGNGIGLDIGGGYHVLVKNCQFVSNTTGASASSDKGTNEFDYNNWYDNTADVSNCTKGGNATANDPGFTNAAGGDFSGVDDADAFGMRLGVG